MKKVWTETIAGKIFIGTISFISIAFISSCIYGFITLNVHNEKINTQGVQIKDLQNVQKTVITIQEYKSVKEEIIEVKENLQLLNNRIYELLIKK